MPLKPWVGSEPIETRMGAFQTNERTAYMLGDGTGMSWSPTFTSQALVHAICIQITSSAAAGGRLPYFQWHKDMNGIAVTSDQCGWFTGINAVAPGLNSIFTWAPGATEAYAILGAVTGIETHGLPDHMTLTQGDHLEFIILNGVVGDVVAIKILYTELL